MQNTLEYANWKNFKKVIDRVMLACKNAKFKIAEHFVESKQTQEMEGDELDKELERLLREKQERRRRKQQDFEM